MSSIQNPSVPFNFPIPGGMYAGKMVSVHGLIPQTSQRFAVNLLTRSGDIALHVCPRFKENQVVRNNVQNMNWGPEERHGSMPVFPGQSFEVIIVCETYSFKIAFNGRHFTEFNHRVPFNTITNLAVDGQVVVYNVNFKEQNTYGNNNNNPSSPGYGFQPVAPTTNSGGLYPSVPPSDSLYPTVPRSGGSYPSNPDTGRYPNSGGSGYPQSPSHYPAQPGYSNIPHQGPYPQIPSTHPSGNTAGTESKPGFFDQALPALAGVIGPAVIAGAMNRKFGTHGYGRHNLMDDAGRALAGVLGGSGVTGSDRSHKGMQPTSPTSHSQSGFLDQAGSTLAGILGGSGLMGTGRSQRGILSSFSTPHNQSGFLNQAGSALAEIVGGGGLTGGGHHKHRNKLGGVLGGTLGTAIAGAALTGHLNPIKAAKKQKKAQKKALKYGLPLAGVGLGAYALHKGFKGFRRSSSSSSCSSSD